MWRPRSVAVVCRTMLRGGTILDNAGWTLFRDSSARLTSVGGSVACQEHRGETCHLVHSLYHAGMKAGRRALFHVAAAAALAALAPAPAFAFGTGEVPPPPAPPSPEPAMPPPPAHVAAT